MGDIAGIDLGTTYSAVARLNAIGSPEILPDADGERITPSAIFFDEDDANIARVGIEALHCRHLNAERSVRWVKRHVGQKDWHMEVDDKNYNAVEISSLILAKLKNECLNDEQKPSVVISVPAHFDEIKRKATMDAGLMAGLDVIGIVNEPVAAALYYAKNKQIEGNVVVYDIGGGTFDVSILQIKGSDITIICSEGDHALGGIDFDRAVLELLKTQYENQFNAELIKTPEEAAKYEDEAEDIKKTLSRRSVAKKMIYGTEGTMRMEISKEMFENAIAPLVTRMDMLLDVALEQANLSCDDINHVLLAGGSSRIPMIQNKLTEKFGFEPHAGGNVDECVALGAAIYAGLTMMRTNPENVPTGISTGLKNINLSDVCNHSYGTLCAAVDKTSKNRSVKNHIILQKNTPLPCQVAETFYTTYAGQKQIELTITQGEDSDPKYVNTIAHQRFELPGERNDRSPVKVVYSYDMNQRMHCTFQDVQSGKILEMQLDICDEDETNSDEFNSAKEKIAAMTVQ
jgi:molecular chaperone DnaK